MLATDIFVSLLSLFFLFSFFFFLLHTFFNEVDSKYSRVVSPYQQIFISSFVGTVLATVAAYCWSCCYQHQYDCLDYYCCSYQSCCCCCCCSKSRETESHQQSRSCRVIMVRNGSIVTVFQLSVAAETAAAASARTESRNIMMSQPHYDH